MSNLHYDSKIDSIFQRLRWRIITVSNSILNEVLEKRKEE